MKKLFLILAFHLCTFVGLAQYSIPMNTTYSCPPCNSTCDSLEFKEPGVCPHCNMVLVRKDLSKTIAFYLQDGVEVLDFAGPMEVFAYAGYKVFTVSLTTEPITSQGILKVQPDYSIDNAPSADILAFFGGNSNAAFENKKVIEWVKNQDNVAYYFSVCTGAFVLAESGILDNRVATTFHNALDNLENNYPKVDVRRDVRFVDNGNEITTAGISAGIDGALHLVAKLQGLNAAKRTAYYMEYDNWNIGDGLILSDDNPYKQRVEEAFLQAFEGTYQFNDGLLVTVGVNNKDMELLATLEGTQYPIYHETGDIFSDVNSRPIFFERNSKGTVIGYRQSQEGPLFKKIN